MEPNVATTPPTVTTRSAGVRYGIINAVIGIALFLIITTAGLPPEILQWGGGLIALILVYFAHKYYKDYGDGFMTYGQGVGIGFWIGLVSAVISSIFSYIYAKLIDPTYVTTIREKAITDMEAKGQSQQQIDAAMPFVEMFTTAESIALMGLFFGILFTVIIALIVSIFTQKPQPEQSI